MSLNEQNVTSPPFNIGPSVLENVQQSNIKSNENKILKALAKFGYKFNESGKLVHIETGAPYKFDERSGDHGYNQQRYEALGEVINGYVYDLLMREGNLKKIIIPINATKEEPKTFIFHSDDAFTNEKLVILIHGSGVVRAGQWARRLIINDCLNTGTQLPFIKRAKGLGYGVIVLNTNDNIREINGFPKKIEGSETPENHANYVWKNIISPKAAAKYIAIIAHSYGGVVAINLCNLFPSAFQERVCAIALTDSPHSLAGQGTPPPLRDWLLKVSRNWVSGSRSLDTPLRGGDQEIECVAAGTTRHDMTSWTSFASVYEFIDAKYRKALAASYETSDHHQEF